MTKPDTGGRGEGRREYDFRERFNKEVPVLVLGGNFTEAPYSMFSASGDAESRAYKLVAGKSGRRWLYNDENFNAGANIYVEGRAGSQGFGGRTICFPLIDGGHVALRGPWASNTHSFFTDTGIDLRSRHATWGCIGRRRERHNDRTAICDLIYFDPKPVEGEFDRVEKLARSMSDQRGELLYFYSMSHDGSSCGPVNWDKHRAALQAQGDER